MGFFRPDMADQAPSCMEMMDFEGKGCGDEPGSAERHAVSDGASNSSSR